MSEDTESRDGRWITMKGTHIFVKKGQTPKEALERTIGKKIEKKQKKEKFKKKQAKRAKEHKKEVAEIDKIIELGLKKKKLKRELLTVERGSKEEKEIIDKIKKLRFEKIQAQRAMAHRKEIKEIKKREKQERELSKKQHSQVVKKGKSDFFQMDSIAMSGAITRAGRFEYKDGTHFKDWNNIKDYFGSIDHLPVIGSKKKDSHLDIDSRLIGFAYNFKPNEDTQQLFADVIFLEDIEDLSDLEDPNKLPVSIGFEDISKTDITDINKVYHLAVSLNKTEIDRCSKSGLPCDISKTSDFQGSSGQETEARKIIKQKEKVDSMGKKKEKDITEDTTEEVEEVEITEDMPATPDNLGSHTDNEAQNTKSAKKGFMLDCQKYGPYPEAQCNNAWNTLQNSPASPIKAGADFEGLKELKSEIADMKSVMGDLAQIIPVLAEVAKDKNNATAQEMVRMKEELRTLDFCDKWVESIEDFDILSKFYQGIIGNKSIVHADTPEEIRASNQSRLLKKKQETDFDDMTEKANASWDARFAKKPDATIVPQGGIQ